MSENDDAEILSISMNKRSCEELDYALADILCWVRGFTAADPENPYLPVDSTDVLRAMRNRLRTVLGK